jgi:hypothetical protein
LKHRASEFTNFAHQRGSGVLNDASIYGDPAKSGERADHPVFADHRGLRQRRPGIREPRPRPRLALEFERMTHAEQNPALKAQLEKQAAASRTYGSAAVETPGAHATAAPAASEFITAIAGTATVQVRQRWGPLRRV